jgi:hypothetical protein
MSNKKPVVKEKGAGTKAATAPQELSLRDRLVAQGLSEIEAAAVARYDDGLREGFAEYLRTAGFQAPQVLSLVRGLGASRRRALELTLRPYPPFSTLIKGAA